MRAKTKVLICVEGGVVQSVQSTNPMIEVEIFDLDNMRAAPEDFAEEDEEGNPLPFDLEEAWAKAAADMVAIY